MKKLFLLSFFVISFIGFAQNRTYIKGTSFILYGQEIKLDQNQSKVFYAVELDLKAQYNANQLEQIKELLVKDFQGSQVVQSSQENKLTIISNKESFSNHNGLLEYVKQKLLQLNLYLGFNSYKESIIELN